MNFATETRRTMVTTGGYSGASADKSKPSILEQFAATRPFTQQLDVVFPSSEPLQREFETLSTRHYKHQWTLTEFADYARPFVNGYLAESSLVALGLPSFDSNDVWCLDTRGVLSLAVGKESYEQLGIVGTKLPWRGCDDTHVTRITLATEVPASNDAHSQKWQVLGPKQRAALKAWDARRGPWDVLFNCSKRDYQPIDTIEEASIKVFEGKPQIRKIANANIPTSTLEPRPQGQDSDDPDLPDWEEETQALFEWAGLACLGSQRLEANDKPDPYLAVYSPPISFQVGNLIHIRWTGLCSPQFVQSVINIARTAPFISVIGHSVPTSPVGYIAPPPSSRSPSRAPRAESEDSWSFIFKSSGSEQLQWALAEHIGQWDARWG